MIPSRFLLKLDEQLSLSTIMVAPPSRHACLTCTTIIWNALVVLVLNELDDDFLLRLNLQHLQHEAQKLRRLLISPVSAPQVSQHHGLVHKSLRRETEAVLLPVPGPKATKRQTILEMLRDHHHATLLN